MVKNKNLKEFAKTTEFQKRTKNQSLHDRTSKFFEYGNYPVDEETVMTLNR